MLDPTAWSSVILGIQWPRKLEKTSENPQAIPLRPLTVSLSATSPWFLNTSWDNDHTTTLGSLCQCMTALRTVSSQQQIFECPRATKHPNQSQQLCKMQDQDTNSKR